MKIELEITDVVGGHKIVAQFSGEEGETPSFDEAYAPTKRSIPTRVKALLTKHFAQESTPVRGGHLASMPESTS